MPLLNDPSVRARQKNIQTETAAKAHGKTGETKKKAIEQAVAIGYAVQRRARSKRAARVRG